VDEPVPVRHLETHVTDACNFACESCSHFSQDGHGGRETPDSFAAQCGPWAKRVSPEWLLLLGGEPTLNPDLLEIVKLARCFWPLPVKVCLVTNGWFLHKFPQLPEVMAENHVRLDLSIHHKSTEYMRGVAPILKLIGDKFAGVEFHIRPSWLEWFKLYHGRGAETRPFQDGDPQASWDSCGSRWCLTLRDGKLWKCPPLAYLPTQAKKFKLHEVREWHPYLAYRPLSPGCTTEALRNFVNREVERFCDMCPANPQRFDKPLPFRKSLEVVG
jgi:Radical SAM superfamily/4Fe-4S single cluster domain